MPSTKRPNGFVLYQDAHRIVIATGFARASHNPKTGDMIQVWILARALNPLDAIQTGDDSLVCGNCALRGNAGNARACYVNVAQAPLAVWRGYQRGIYPMLTDFSVFDGRSVRFGAYGDPAFIPYPLLQAIHSRVRGWTGYTHQWRNPLFQAYSRYLMASADSQEDYLAAKEKGWRTFRVTDDLQKRNSDEIVCPNTTKGVTCEKCGLCSGTLARARKNIVIEVHGPGKGNF